MVKIGTNINEEALKTVTGGAGTTAPGSKVSGVECYGVEQKICPICGSNQLVYKTFITDDGKGTRTGQHCACGCEWIFGSRVGIL
ncbi:MAG: hypothetical protein IJR45_01320 [Firmicutes bacterium]|nr:hypothetical protein [Bacillota bacterium]